MVKCYHNFLIRIVGLVSVISMVGAVVMWSVFEDRMLPSGHEPCILEIMLFICHLSLPYLIFVAGTDLMWGLGGSRWGWREGKGLHLPVSWFWLVFGWGCSSIEAGVSF